ncbi:MAG: hypothetical protein ACE148_02220 [Vicinamibacterales bacterium]
MGAPRQAQAVVFCGIQASGKTTFFRERFFETHVRIDPGVLRTRHREQLLLKAASRGRQRLLLPRRAARRNGTQGARERLELPARDEGFHELYVVTIAERGGFEARPW